MGEGRNSHDECPVDRLLNKIAGPWTTYILWLLRQNRALRFGELRAHMPGISPKVLTERLRRLEADRLIFRNQRPTIPPQVFYGLTARGEELKEILDALGATAQRWAEEDSDGVSAPSASAESPASDEAHAAPSRSE
ncbi:helix-turn-helix domain-containing protein [uncultured Rhodoblastus sp.]|uniref:winged helix-turn-helix transcriptional regulator n=1 Tax=uncultured Rhodoblastus sp. TaxID=543037 RepID=UPI0025EB1695|nr:helix-turn-helix domain-containing protein [uncultured Rhodoblastus sp.]